MMFADPPFVPMVMFPTVATAGSLVVTNTYNVPLAEPVTLATTAREVGIWNCGPNASNSTLSVVSENVSAAPGFPPSPSPPPPQPAITAASEHDNPHRIRRYALINFFSPCVPARDLPSPLRQAGIRNRSECICAPRQCSSRFVMWVWLVPKHYANERNDDFARRHAPSLFNSIHLFTQGVESRGTLAAFARMTQKLVYPRSDDARELAPFTRNELCPGEGKGISLKPGAH